MKKTIAFKRKQQKIQAQRIKIREQKIRNRRLAVIEQTKKENTNIGKIFLAIVIAILIVTIFRLMITEGELNFTTMLQKIVEIGNLNVNYIQLTDLTITGDWGIFDWYKTLLNQTLVFWNVIIWFCGNIINLIDLTVNIFKILLF